MAVGILALIAALICWQAGIAFAQTAKETVTVREEVSEQSRVAPGAQTTPQSMIEKTIIERKDLSVIPEQPALTVSDYSTRLRHLMEWINLGVSRGWLTGDQARRLQDAHSRIAGMEEKWRSDGLLDRREADYLEHRLTWLNQVIAEAMQGRDIASVSWPF